MTKSSQQETTLQEEAQTQTQTNPKKDAKTAELPPLKPAQRRALVMLAAGEGVGAAAMSAGVHRNTISRWLREPAFAAELQAMDAELRELGRARLYAMIDRAATCVEAALARGDARMALQLLKAMGVFRLEAPAGAAAGSLLGMAGLGGRPDDPQTPDNPPPDGQNGDAWPGSADALRAAGLDAAGAEAAGGAAAGDGEADRYFSPQFGDLGPGRPCDEPAAHAALPAEGQRGPEAVASYGKRAGAENPAARVAWNPLALLAGLMLAVAHLAGRLAARAAALLPSVPQRASFCTIGGGAGNRPRRRGRLGDGLRRAFARCSVAAGERVRQIRFAWDATFCPILQHPRLIRPCSFVLRA